MNVSHKDITNLNSTMSGLRDDRRPWWEHWRELADFFLPRRYVWLLSPNEWKRVKTKNPFILDGTGTNASRTLAAGMMNGITSPSRPWFRLRLAGYEDDVDQSVRIWLDEVQRRMMLVMAESNFYNAMATTYLDLSVFGSSAHLIYEDQEKIIHCFNSPLGEFYLGHDDKQRINYFAREFNFKIHQIISRWGVENVTTATKALYEQGGASLQKSQQINHLIEPNEGGDYGLSSRFKFREVYWEDGATDRVLAVRGFYEMPGIFPRWEILGNDAYGSSPAMDALPDVIQLQQETKRKGQSLDLMNRPPMVADIQLQHQPTALVPGGMTYVANANSVGMKPAYQINPPIQEMTFDIRDVQARIRETLHNDLFQMISQLDTVRTATEIDARREEKLVLLGPVLERFENEALDPAINRIYSIMERRGLIPEPPPGYEGVDLQIQYVSILSAAQNAVSAAPAERFLQVLAGVLSVEPGARDLVDWDTFLLEYGKDISVKSKIFRDPAQVEEIRQAEAEALAAAEAAATGQALAQGAKTLSETDVGGGSNALQAMMARG